MTSPFHIQFATQDGTVLVPTDDGRVHLESEFVPWSVKWIGADMGPPFARQNGEPVALIQRQDSYTLPPPKRTKDRQKKPAGDLVLYRDSTGSEPLRPTLRVHAANLSDEHYRLLLRDLGGLIAGISYYLSPDGVSRGQGPWVDSSEDTALVAAVATVQAMQELLNHLRRVRLRPAHSLTWRVRSVRIEQAIRHGSAALMSKEIDGRDRVRAPVLDVTEDTKERSFVSAVVGALTVQARALATFIDSQRALVGERDTELRSMSSAMESYGVARRQVSETAPLETTSQLLLSLGRELKRVWPMEAPRIALQFRSNQIELSSEYGPILRLWHRVWKASASSKNSESVLRSLDSASIDETVVLYERWILVKFYATLVSRGFAPPAGEPSLLDTIRVTNGEIQVKGQRLLLVKWIGDDLLSVSLDFDRVIDIGVLKRQPDLLIHCLYQGKERRWVFDAKYKDYSRPAPPYQRQEEVRYGSHFLADLLGVAEERYRATLNAEVSAILHPDARDRFQFWDADRVPLGTPHRRPDRHPHELLSACLLPGPSGSANMTKLLRLLFGFHAGLKHVCWRCGTLGHHVPTDKTSGRCYSCPTCQSFWIDHWCINSRSHHLLKYGRSSFHRVRDNDPFNAICPWCGKSL